VIKTPPFRCQEEGWGEFDMALVLHTIGKGGDHPITHDLNFTQERYEASHKVVSSIVSKMQRRKAQFVVTMCGISGIQEPETRTHGPAARERTRAWGGERRQGGEGGCGEKEESRGE